MGIAGLFRRNRSVDRNSLLEPVSPRVASKPDSDELLDGLIGDVSGSAATAAGKDAVYGVIGSGTVAAVTGAPARPQDSPVEADQLLDALYAQYRLALVLPDSVHRESRWVGGNQRNEVRDLRIGAPDDPSAVNGTVSELLRGHQSIDQAFGLLDSELPASLQPEEPADVLALFAPPDLQVNPSRGGRMSGLARREHHLMSIDSSIYALETESDNASKRKYAK